MGLFSAIGSVASGIASGIGSLFGGSSSGNSAGGSYGGSSKTYEPDKVRVAEIEQETQILLADKEKERIKLMNDAKIELLQQEYYLKAAYEEARAKGFEHMAYTIINMQDKLNEIAEKRFQIIEKGSMQLIQDVESFYSTVEDKLTLENEEYNKKKLPALLEILENFEPGSAAHNLYAKKVEKDMEVQVEVFLSRMSKVAERQKQVVDSLLTSKERLLEQTGKLTENMLEKATIEYSKLNSGQIEKKQALPEDSNRDIKIDESKLIQ